MKKAFIIGLGLIGGSISLAIKKAHDVNVTGFDINDNQLKLALSLQIIDEIAVNLQEGAQNADLIIISAPVQQTKRILHELVDCELKSSVIITDVGSTKQLVVDEAKILAQKGITFIGGHPMAGSHKSGVVAAKAHLFENAFYLLTPTTLTPQTKVDELKDWLRGTKAQFLEMTPEQHDHVAGAISHFPHIIAASLVHQVAEMEKDNEMIGSLAAGGFRDITRIASSSPVMWRDILLHNKEKLLEILKNWRVEMQKVEEMIGMVDGEAIFNYFEDAKNFRDRLPQRQRGALPSFYDLYVDVPDHPGVISDVTGILAKQEISITNIRIIEAREDIMGVLQLSFQNENDRKRAKLCLESHQYDTYLLT